VDASSWDKAKDLIADALELPASERDAYLRAQCADPLVLAEIRDIIRDYTKHSSFLERPPDLSLDLLDPPDDGLEPGSQVGPYILVDRLGQGGMGQVFLGSDRRLKRKVALKRLLPSPLGAADERARIMREARAAAQINHPNVATIHDVIEHEAQVFIVMEYIDGESLAERLRRGRLPQPQVISIGAQIASALAAAHAMGIVHRDMKPGNVQLSRDGVPKVLDFGVAKAVAASGSSTASGGAMEIRGAQPGTLEYMSPEQMVGREVDHRSDLFSLGIVLFEMATGRRPYTDDNAVDRFAALQSPAPRADAIDPDVPTGLADVIARALKTDLNQRFQSAAEVAALLDAMQRDLQTAAAAGIDAGLAASRRVLLLKAVMAGLATAVVLGILGAVTTATFNLALQRPARFGVEPLPAYVLRGFQSNFMLLFSALVVATVAGSITFAVRVLSLFSVRFDAAVQRWQARRNVWVERLGLGDSLGFGQSLAALGVVGVIGVIAWHHSLISAYMRFVSLATPEQLLPLAPDNFNQRALYRMSVNLLLLTVGLGLVRLLRLRARDRSGGGAAAAWIASAMLAIVAVLHVFPYRILFQNQFERVDVAGARCYLLGEDGTEGFVFCPEAGPPRSRVIRTDAADVHRRGTFESIFTPPFERETR
jgi:protein kinase-like protein